MPTTVPQPRATPAGGPHGSLAGLSPIPLYYQIAKVLQARIASGLYPPGAQIDTEEVLARTFGVSRLTVRNAIAVLQEQGLLERHRARGTFVARDIQHRKRRAFAQLHGFVEDVILLGDFGRTLWAERDQVEAPPDIAAELGLQRGTPVVRVRRVRSIGSSTQPDGWVTNYLPQDIGLALDAERLGTDSLIHLLNELPGLRLSAGAETISARPADAETAERLALAPGSPILLVERILQDETGRTVDVARFHQRGDRISYSVRLSRIWR